MTTLTLSRYIQTKTHKNNQTYSKSSSNREIWKKNENKTRKKKHYWKPYGYKFPILKGRRPLNRYVRIKLNLYPFPKKNGLREFSKKGNKWRKFLFKKLRKMRLRVKRTEGGWHVWKTPKELSNLSQYLNVLHSKFNYVHGTKTKHARYFFNELKGRLLIDGCIHLHTEITDSHRFRETRSVKTFKINRNRWQKLTHLYRLATLTAQAVYYNEKYVSKKFLANNRLFFSLYHQPYRKAPWKNALIHKRYTYNGSPNRWADNNYTRPYLRIKRPYKEKRARIFNWFHYQLGSKESKRHSKPGRTKQILSKVFFSFYGQIKSNQFTNIVKKIKRIKSKRLTRTDALLSRLELRLDVLVYRLNLAPSIFWAKELINAGKIFVLKNTQQNNWSVMYKNIWSMSFPLRLRDPKNMYAKNDWLNELAINRFKFFLAPITNPNYLVKVGDTIYTGPESRINKFFMTKILFKKPLPQHLMASSESRFGWHLKLPNPRLTPTAMWQKQGKHPLNSVILFNPRTTDLPRSDRIKPDHVKKLMI